MAKAALCYAYGKQRRDAVVRSSSCHGRPSLAGIFSSLSLYFLYLNGVYRGEEAGARSQRNADTRADGAAGGRSNSSRATYETCADVMFAIAASCADYHADTAIDGG